MGGYKTWAALEEVTAANMNTYVRDNTVPQFASAAARSAAIAAPVVGTMSYLTDTGSFEVYYGATTGWRRPWSIPWGLVTPSSGSNPASLTTNQATITTVTDITNLSVTWSALSTRQYRVVLQVQAISSVLDDLMQVLITDSSNNIKAASTVPIRSTNYAVGVQAVGIFSGLSGTTTLKGRVLRQAGTGSGAIYAGATYPSIMFVEDIGPSGNAPAA